MNDFRSFLYAQGYPQARVIAMAVIPMPQMNTASTLTERAAEEVRALMGRYQITQVQLSAVLGVSQPQVGKRLKGVVPFDVNEIGLLADYFGVDPAELLGGRPSPRPGGPDGGSSNRVRHQGLEPRTRWYEGFAA